MTLRRIACILCLLGCAALLRAQNPKEQAKTLHQRADSETNDQAKQATDYCNAKKLDPNNKEYSKDCEGAEVALRKSDTKNLQIVQTDFTNADYAATINDAKYVGSYFPDIRGHADDLVVKAKAKLDAANHPAPPPPPARPPTTIPSSC